MATTPPRLPLSLPAVSPLSNPFDSPTTPIFHTDGSLDSPMSDTAVSPLRQDIRQAYIVPRASAELLIRVLDLATNRSDEMQGELQDIARGSAGEACEHGSSSVDIPSPSTAHLPSPRPTFSPSRDKSFLRMTRSSVAFSDTDTSLAPARSIAPMSEASYLSEEVPRSIPSVGSSNGTFGSHSRQHSTVDGVSAQSGSGNSGKVGKGRLGDRFWTEDDEDASRTTSSGRRRPLFLSASHSAHSTSGRDRSSRVPARAKISAGRLPSTAEKETPRHSPSSLGSVFRMAPPSSGTPLTGSVTEESSRGSSEVGHVAVSGQPKRAMSKLDQMLGEGAETARVLMELERRAVESSVEQFTPKTPGPVPPGRGLKPFITPFGNTPTTSSRMYTCESPFLACTPSTPSDNVDSRTRLRSDSLDSLRPSLVESTDTASRLIPQYAYKALPPTPSPKRHGRPVPLVIAVRNDLHPEQRAMLLKRTRKLEQLLGQPLDEREIERLVIEPASATRTINTRFEQDFWPPSPICRDPTPNWAREDCTPRTIGEDVHPEVSRSDSSVSRKARAVLGLDRHAPEVPAGLRIYVGREMRVSETATRGFTPNQYRDTGQARTRRQASPTDTIDQVWPADPPDEDEDTRRARRHQLDKLHRLLGVPIPVSLLTPLIQDSRVDPFDRSFMTFDEEAKDPSDPPLSSGWSSKLRMRDKKIRSATSFMDLRDSAAQSGLGSQSRPELTDKEKAIARRKAQKLEQVFGDVPPRDLFILSDGSTDKQSRAQTRPLSADAHKPSTPAEPSDAYQQSLEGLLHLVDRDRLRLASIVDSLEDPASARDIHQQPFPTRSARDPPSPPTPILASPTSPRWLDDTPSPGRSPDPNSHAARGRRTGKLTQFFGERGVDLGQPHHDLPRITQSRKSRRETLDMLIVELWRSLQVELRKGAMAKDEVGRLEDVMSALRGRRESLNGWKEL